MLNEESKSRPMFLDYSSNNYKLLSLSNNHDSSKGTFEPFAKTRNLSSTFKESGLHTLASGESNNIDKGVLETKCSSQFSSPVANTVPQNTWTVNIGSSVNSLNNLVQSHHQMLINTHINQPLSAPKEVKNSAAFSKLNNSSHSNNLQECSNIEFSIIPATAVKNSHFTPLCYNNQSTSAVVSTQTGRSTSSSAVLNIKKPVFLFQDQNGTKCVKLHVKKPVSNFDSRAIKRTVCVQKPAFNIDLKSSIRPNCNLKHMKNDSNKNAKLFQDPIVLRTTLMPCLLHLITQYPEPDPFREPVGANKTGYCDVIKHPMDISTIKTKLDTGQYQDAWEFIDDVWLMFNNVQLYSKKRKSFYKYYTQLTKLFKENIDFPMKSLGYCCGQNYTFEPRILYCQSKENCLIAKNAKYWSFQDKYNICKKCVSQSKENIILYQSSGTTLVINVNMLTEKINNIIRPEEFVMCIYCNIKQHRICCLQVDEMWKEGFICEKCKVKFGKMRILPSQFQFKSLKQTKLGSHLEIRVNSFLEKQGCVDKVEIRVVYQGRKEFPVAEGLKSRYVDTGIWPEKFPYTAKTILVFQEQISVCFFALFVQEYGSDCPKPNTRRVYISYLDSVHFFTPKHHRTSVYHEILLGYLDYVRCLGYKTVHLWSCPPPNEKDDYIFYCHPKDQKVPTMRRLQVWYQTLLAKAVSEGIVSHYKDIFEQAIEDNVKNAFELPYFDGDFLPATLEKEILQNIQEENSNDFQKNVSKGNEMEIYMDEKKKKFSKYKKGKKYSKKVKNSSCQYTEDKMTDKMYSIMKKHRKCFLVIHLCTLKNVLNCAINDPDPLISSTIMDARESFLNMAREKDWEFSSLRRARYSTMALVYNLHKDSMELYTCNMCKNVFLNVFHCLSCEDFDLCCDCYSKTGHYDHKMEKINQDYQFYDKYQAHGKRKRVPMVFLNLLHHFSQCSNMNCTVQNCMKFKDLQEHVKGCKVQGLQCRFCFYYAYITYCHFLKCEVQNCQILMCRKLKAVKSDSQISQHLYEEAKSNGNLKRCTESIESDGAKKISELTRAFLLVSQTHISRNVHIPQKLPLNNSSYNSIWNENPSIVNNCKWQNSDITDSHNKSVLSESLENNINKIKHNCAVTGMKSEETKSHSQKLHISNFAFTHVSESLVTDAVERISNCNEHKKSVNDSSHTFIPGSQPVVSDICTMSSTSMTNTESSSIFTKEIVLPKDVKTESFNSLQGIEISAQNMIDIQKSEVKTQKGVHSNVFSQNQTQLHVKLEENSDVLNRCKSESKPYNAPISNADIQRKLYTHTQFTTKTSDAYFYSADNQHVKLPNFQQRYQHPVSLNTWKSSENNILYQKNHNKAVVSHHYENNSSQFLTYSQTPVCHISTHTIGTLNSIPEKYNMHDQFTEVYVPNNPSLNLSAMERNKKVTTTDLNYDNLSCNAEKFAPAHFPLSSSMNYQNSESSASASIVDQSEMHDLDSFSVNYCQFPGSNTVEFPREISKNNEMLSTQTSNINVSIKHCADDKNCCDVSSSQRLHSFETPVEYRNDASAYEEYTSPQYNVLNSQGMLSNENFQCQPNIYQPEFPVQWTSSGNVSLCAENKQSVLQHGSILSATNNKPSEQLHLQNAIIYNIEDGKNFEFQGNYDNQCIASTQQQDFTFASTELPSQFNPSETYQWNSVYQTPSAVHNVNSHLFQNTSQYEVIESNDVQHFIKL